MSEIIITHYFFQQIVRFKTKDERLTYKALIISILYSPLQNIHKSNNQHITKT